MPALQLARQRAVGGMSSRSVLIEDTAVRANNTLGRGCLVRISLEAIDPARKPRPAGGFVVAIVIVVLGRRLWSVLRLLVLGEGLVSSVLHGDEWSTDLDNAKRY